MLISVDYKIDSRMKYYIKHTRFIYHKNNEKRGHNYTEGIGSIPSPYHFNYLCINAEPATLPGGGWGGGMGVYPAIKLIEAEWRISASLNLAISAKPLSKPVCVYY